MRDYVLCSLIKRERIDGDLHDTQFIQARVRTEAVENGHVVQPYSAFLEFQGPAKIKGRKVLYVQGRNDNKMLVRNGGKRFNYVTVKVDPKSEAAMSESLVPITGIGFASVTDSLITLIRQDIERDPLGTNTKVKFYRHAKINGRVCTRISVLHPNPDPVLEFSEANVYVDDELHVPIRIEALIWPKTAGEPKPLLFEYTYTDLRLNVGLTDEDFRTGLMDRKRSKVRSIQLGDSRSTSRATISAGSCGTLSGLATFTPTVRNCSSSVSGSLATSCASSTARSASDASSPAASRCSTRSPSKSAVACISTMTKGTRSSAASRSCAARSELARKVASTTTV